MNPNLNKIGFPTEDEARTELQRIVNTNYNPCPKRNKKPTRYYYDEDLEMWYLTSSPKIIVY